MSQREEAATNPTKEEGACGRSDTDSKTAENLRPRKKKDYREKGVKGTKPRLYNADGVFLKDGSDFCDCLVDGCPGCHFPCEKCRSPKCGHECRQNRKWTYERCQVEGTSEVIVNSHIEVPFAKQMEKLSM